MNIGILTLYNSDSFGAVLQSYALQQTLNKLGVKSEFVSFPKRIKNGPEKRFEGIKGAEPLVKLFRREFLKRSKLFEEFRKKYFIISKEYRFEDEALVNNSYDVFISGSDQVWNLNLPDVDSRYFLVFADKNKKFSYAASFGSQDIKDKHKDKIRDYLSDFNTISVREASGQKIIKNLIGKDSYVHIDPTLLLDVNTWDELVEYEKDEDYVFVYMLSENKDMINYAKQYAKDNNLKAYFVSDSFSNELGFDTWNKTNVNKWLGLIKNAKAIITNSYHGVIFSILYAKPFGFFPLTGNINTRNERIFQLLEKLNLKYNHINNVPIENENYLEIHKEIECEKKKSLEYLSSIINGSYNENKQC